ncbi:hypothetical protein M0802_011872 [Mischocyttarus mexicanus]|nr:hypothetical protein M0802_011872 [Mischocyttarus mexicanus]
MINIGIFVIFSLTLTTVNTIYYECDNSNCKCSPVHLGKIKIVCTGANDTKFVAYIKTGDSVEITCEAWIGWQRFKLMSTTPGEAINSLTIKYCGLSNTLRLIDVIKKFKTEDTTTLVFQSFRFLDGLLNEQYFEGFPNVKKLVLSFNGLTKISYDFFLSFPHLEWLDLSDNKLVLSSDIFDEIPQLKRLELIRNGIDDIEPRMFYFLRNLEYLSLMGNKLTGFIDGTFDDLVSLKVLILKLNPLRLLSRSTFHSLRKLETVDISFTNLSSINPQLFNQTKELRKFYFIGNSKQLITLPDKLLSNLENLEEVFLNYDGFQYLPKDLFWDSVSIKHIDLNNNFLLTLPQEFFKGLRNLRELGMRNNKIEGFPDGTFKDLENLEVFDLSINRIIFITTNFFEGLKSLKELNMEKNQLKYIADTALFHLKSLNIAKFSHNKLILNNTSGKLSSFHNNIFIMELHLSNNSIPCFYVDWSKNLLNLRLLNLSHNEIKVISDSHFAYSSDKIQVDLRYNKISNILLNRAELISYSQHYKREVYIYIDNNPILCDCKLYDLLRYRHLKMAKTVYNFFTFVFGNLTCNEPYGLNERKISELHPFTYKCPEEELLNLDTRCQVGCTCSVRLKDKSRILDCSYQNMTEFYINKTRINYVANFSIIVNLTGNLLMSIPSTVSFLPLTVTGLLLSNNRIFDLTINNLPASLKVLELHDNFITRIDSSVIHYLNNTPLLEFTLRGNPIICDCDAQDLLLYVREHEFYFRDLRNLLCAGFDLPMYELTIHQLCYDFKTKTLSITLTIIIITLSTLFAIGSFYICVYKSRSSDSLDPASPERPEMIEMIEMNVRYLPDPTE